MKRVLFCLSLFSALFFSCSKDSFSLPAFADGSLEYKVNDNPVKISNLNVALGEAITCVKQSKTSEGESAQYLFTAKKGTGNVLIFSIVTDSLHTGDYIIDTGTVNKYGNPNSLLFNTVSYSSLLLADDNVHIHISEYAKGYISGSFTAKLSPLAAQNDNSLHGTTLVTGGTFTSVQCLF